MATEYVNNHAEILLMPTDHVIFRAATCGRYDSGYDVTVKVDLPENPALDVNFGVVLFALSHSNSSTDGVSMLWQNILVVTARRPVVTTRLCVQVILYCALIYCNAI